MKSRYTSLFFHAKLKRWLRLHAQSESHGRKTLGPIFVFGARKLYYIDIKSGAPQ